MSESDDVESGRCSGQLSAFVPSFGIKTGDVESEKMTNSLVAPLRYGLIISVVAFCLIWSLLSLDVHTSSIKIVHSGAQEVSTEVQQNTLNENTGLVQGSSDTQNKTGGEHLNSDASTISNRPLILYAYADSETGIALENFKFFIAHGLHAAADFIFIFNGETAAASLVPKKDNIKVVQRTNTCYDLGAFAEVLLKDDLYKKYNRFITMNASIRGPFVPYWSEGCWTDMFLNKITDEVKLVGITANCEPTFHIQSMIWATDLTGITTLLFPPKKALEHLSTHPIKIPFKNELSNTINMTFGINGCFDYGTAVIAEVSSTPLLLAAGYKVDAMMLAYHGMKKYHEEKTCEGGTDVLWEGGYYGIDVSPFETVFFKANRKISPKVLEHYSEWTKERAYSSYDYCKA